MLRTKSLKSIKLKIEITNCRLKTIKVLYTDTHLDERIGPGLLIMWVARESLSFPNDKNEILKTKI